MGCVLGPSVHAITSRQLQRVGFIHVAGLSLWTCPVGLIPGLWRRCATQADRACGCMHLCTVIITVSFFVPRDASHGPAPTRRGSPPCLAPRGVPVATPVHWMDCWSDNMLTGPQAMCSSGTFAVLMRSAWQCRACTNSVRVRVRDGKK